MSAVVVNLIAWLFLGFLCVYFLQFLVVLVVGVFAGLLMAVRWLASKIQRLAL